VEIPEELRLRCDRIDELQAEDSERFVVAAPTLLRRLELSRRVITAMTCDDRFSILFANWAAGCDRHGIDVRATTLVFPTDDRACERIESLGFVAYFDDQSQFLREMTTSTVYGDSAWSGYMHHQNWVIAQLLALDVDVLFQDVDVVWRRDPRPALQAQAAQGAAVQAMYDGPNPRFQPLYANSGFMYLRNTPEVRSLWAAVCAHNEMVDYYRSQQEPLNVILAAHSHRGLDVRVLDEDRFANGHRYCDRDTPPENPWVVHFSWTADLATKLERYAAHDQWFLDDAARVDPAGSLSMVVHAKPPADNATGANQVRPPSNPGDREVARLLRLLDSIRRDRDALARQLETMEHSTSWRATSPMRRAKAAWKRRRC
jgi:hypothetical protein